MMDFAKSLDMVFKCNKNRYSCYTLHAVIQVNNSDYGFFSLKFIDLSKLGGTFSYVFMKKFFMLLFRHFIDITDFAYKNKNVLRLFYFWNVLS